VTQRQPTPPPYGAVVFDCDSTLASIEGIEALAVDASDEVRARIGVLTAKAMDGSVPLEEAYGARLEELRPTRADVQRIGQLYLDNALPHARELCAAMRELGKQLFVVSGGLLAPVQCMAEFLGIPAANVFAVDVRFDASGHYAGFDEQSPLARAGGKLEVLGQIAAKTGANLALIGDGATDLEAAPACARFIAFAGVEARPAVMQAADAVCTHADLAGLLKFLCTDEELHALANNSHHAPLLSAAKRLD
jgi:phosphoserine phosphatase